MNREQVCFYLLSPTTFATFIWRERKREPGRFNFFGTAARKREEQWCQHIKTKFRQLKENLCNKGRLGLNSCLQSLYLNQSPCNPISSLLSLPPASSAFPSLCFVNPQPPSLRTILPLFFCFLAPYETCVNKYSNIQKSQVLLTTQVLMEAQSTVSMISEKNTPNSHSLDPLCESRYTLRW